MEPVCAMVIWVSVILASALVLLRIVDRSFDILFYTKGWNRPIDPPRVPESPK
jgi:hypothetical protein